MVGLQVGFFLTSCGDALWKVSNESYVRCLLLLNLVMYWCPLVRLLPVSVVLFAFDVFQMLQVSLNAGVNVSETYVAAYTAPIVILACAAAGNTLGGDVECVY
ncbi:hypothetical protein AF72_00825 [Xylella taiwanensis]|uniref:Uncharacterized protein n=1 Tax=Xylella taiwanensis TaxID=1444770 RepID=Z9JN83_9GAMM|nr:hypothetical protein AB672_11265 [Xylella taiwanensis]EWS79458.1 hypothetical protein AF72_00825 [Xylella taiwanensis]